MIVFNKYIKPFGNFTLGLLFIFILAACSGTSFKSYQVKSFKGVSIPELSDDPIMIEKISKDLIETEELKKSLNLPKPS